VQSGGRYMRGMTGVGVMRRRCLSCVSKRGVENCGWEATDFAVDPRDLPCLVRNFRDHFARRVTADCGLFSEVPWQKVVVWVVYHGTAVNPTLNR